MIFSLFFNCLDNSIMKKLLYIFTLLFSYVIYAQLYVSANSYVYNNGTVVFVNQDVNLQNNGNLYLRNEGQLVQATAGISTNKGTGKISVFQEGTSDNFDYNYWCSPVGNASIFAGNEAFGITMLGQPTTLTATTPATILATNNYNGSANPLAIAPYWIYKFLSSSTYSQWFQVGANTIISAGEGFTMKGTSGNDVTDIESNGVQNNPGGNGAQRYDFRGKPNDGNIIVNVDTNNFTLTGNPYPSALHVNKFLLDASNTSCTGIAYYWEQNKAVNSHFLAQYQGGYGTYSPINETSNGLYVAATFNTYNGDGSLNIIGTASGLVIERKYAPIGQGFMVKGNSSGAITLKNSHRDYYKENGNLSQFERSPVSQNNQISSANFAIATAQQVSHFKLNTSFNNQFTKQIALAFVAEATDLVDRGIDALSPSSNDLPNDVYFFLENEKYVIQGINFDVNKRIPIGVKSTGNTIFKFHIPEVINFDENQMIYLFDAQTGIYHNVKNADYEIILPTGIYNNRFEITFSEFSLNTNTLITNDYIIFQNNSHQILTISNPNLTDLKSIILYDLSGKLIINKENLGNNDSYQLSTSGLSNSVYLVEICSNDGQKSVKKIIVSTVEN